MSLVRPDPKRVTCAMPDTRRVVAYLPIGTMLVLGWGCHSSTINNPTGAPQVPAMCPVKGDPLHPIVVGQEDRSIIEGFLKQGRLVVVRVADRKVTPLPSCTIPGGYRYSASTWAETRCDQTNGAEADESLSFHFVQESAFANMSNGFSLFYGTRGSWIYAGQTPRSNAAPGACDEATHYASAISVGAWATVAGSSDAIGAGVNIGSLLGGTARFERGATVAQQTGSLEGCEADAGNGPSPNCDAPLRLSLEPIERGDCVLKLVAEAQLRDGRSQPLGQCNLDGEVNVSVTGSVIAKCDSSNADACGNEAKWAFDVNVGDTRLPVEERAPACPEKPRAHRHPLAGFVLGRANVAKGVGVSLIGKDCSVKDSQDGTCYFAQDFEVRLSPVPGR